MPHTSVREPTQSNIIQNERTQSSLHRRWSSRFLKHCPRISSESVRYLSYVFIIIFALISVGLCGFGVHYIFRKNIIITEKLTEWGAMAITGIGVFSVIASIIGFIGLIQKRLVFMRIFFWLLIFVCFLKFFGGIALYLVIKKTHFFKKKTDNIVYSWIEEYYEIKAIRKIVDVIQEKMNCCGSHGPSDWADTGNDIPYSCCDRKEDECSEENATQDGCSHKMFYWFLKKVSIQYAPIWLTIFMLEIVGILVLIYHKYYLYRQLHTVHVRFSPSVLNRNMEDKKSRLSDTKFTSLAI